MFPVPAVLATSVAHCEQHEEPKKPKGQLQIEARIAGYSDFFNVTFYGGEGLCSG